MATRPVTGSSSVYRMQLWLEGPACHSINFCSAHATLARRPSRISKGQVPEAVSVTRLERLALRAKSQVEANVTLHHFIESALS